MSDYPEWLGSDLLLGKLPWANAIRSTLPTFLEEYSLHDSYWIGLHIESRDEATLLIRWDTFWTEKRVPFPGSVVADWPLLCIRLTNLVEAEVHLLEVGIAGATSRLLETPAASSSPTPGHQCETVIEDHTGGLARLVHCAEAGFLCLTPQRQVLPIPGLTQSA